MNKNNFKFKFCTPADMKLLETAVEVDYKGNRKNYVKTFPILTTPGAAEKAPKTASSFLKEFVELCDKSAANVCMNISLGTLCDLKNSGVLVMNTNKEMPDRVQRNIVKDPNWVSNLVADLLIGYQAIPSVTLSSEKEEDEIKLFATDGQQRLFAIIALLNNELKFTGTNTCLDNKRFCDLPLEVQEVLKGREIIVQISKPEFSSFRKYSFIKLNTTATSLNSIEMANAMHSSEFSMTLKAAVKDEEHPYIAAMVTTVPSKKGVSSDLVQNFSALPKPLKDRQTEYDRLLFAYANAKTELGEVTSANRSKRALQINYLSAQENKKIHAEKLVKEINRVSKLMYILFGVQASREYATKENDDGSRSYIKDADGGYRHKTSISNMQYNSLYLICNYLYNEGVRASKITASQQKKAREILDNYFAEPHYVVMKGWNNSNSVYKSNMTVAQSVLNLFKEAC